MKIDMPIKCPVCGEIMLTNFNEKGGGLYSFSKLCQKTTWHNIEFQTLTSETGPHNQVGYITIVYTNGDTVTWYMQTKPERCHFYKHSEYKLIRYTQGIAPPLLPKLGQSIPFFEPDFSDYPKLLNKLKTYLIFS